MKSYRKELIMNVPARRGFVNITSQVNTCVRESGITEGLVLVNPMHITASVFINDDESGLHRDYEPGWRNWHPMNLSVNTGIMIPVKIMPMPISNVN
jgi:thiamine phosphate synthase YjbQ (UPF0047 family)